MANKDQLTQKQVLEIALDQMNKAITMMDGIIERMQRELLEDFTQEELLSAEIPTDRTVH